MLSVLRRTPIAFASAVALVAACSKGDKTADSARTTDSSAVAATSTTAMTPAASAAPAAPAMSDANIFGFLDAANVADSSAGSVAAAKGTSSEVKSFGRDMMRDHHALRKGGQDLAKKLNITPEPPAGDTTAASAAAWKDSLNAMPRGAAWDKAYIAHEVADHEKVLNTAQSAAGATQNAEIKSMIEKAAPTVQKHLDHAKQIQSKLQ